MEAGADNGLEMASSDAQVVRSVEVTRDNGAPGTIGVYGKGNGVKTRVGPHSF